MLSPIDWRSELERLHTMSFAWALQCCRQRREEAQDVLQEVYVRVLEGRARYAGRASSKTWLFSVIRRTAREHRRRNWLRAALTERWLEHPTHDAVLSPERAASDSARALELRAALSTLPRRQQEVLHLVFFQDLTIAAAGELLGISVGSARTHFERGKARLGDGLRDRDVS